MALRMKSAICSLLIALVVAGCSKKETHRVDLSLYPKAEILTASGAVISIDSSQRAGGDMVTFKTPKGKTEFECWTEQHKVAGWDISEARDDGIVVQVHGVGLLPSGRLLFRIKDGKPIDITNEHLSWSVDFRHGPLTIEEPNQPPQTPTSGTPAPSAPDAAPSGATDR